MYDDYWEGENSRVTTVTISNKLEDYGTISVEDPFSSVLYGLSDGDNIHAISLKGVNLVKVGEQSRRGE